MLQMSTDQYMGCMFLFHLYFFGGSLVCLNNRYIEEAKDAQQLSGNRKKRGTEGEGI